MFDDYLSIVRELKDLGYNVVPKRNEEIPHDKAGALKFIEESLAASEVSVHLLGESGGRAPEDLDPIVKLQLSKAADKSAGSPANSDGQGAAFPRIIWAPKVFRQNTDANGKTIERDPFDILGRFSEHLPTDVVASEDPVNFVHSLIEILDKLKPRDVVDDSRPVDLSPSNSKAYILYYEKDRPLARGIRKALLAQKVDAIFPASDGDEADRKAYDKESMRICDSIVLCWGHASQVWTLAQARQFSDWRALGRSKEWSRRSLVLGPPPGTLKDELKEDGPPSEIDVVVDLPDANAIPPELLSKLVPRVSVAGS
jgi:hypothetical protein